jgi:hypothetical protein
LKNKLNRIFLIYLFPQYRKCLNLILTRKEILLEM